MRQYDVVTCYVWLCWRIAKSTITKWLRTATRSISPIHIA